MKIYAIKSKGYRVDKDTGEVKYKEVCEDSAIWGVDDKNNAQIASGCVCDGVGSLKNSANASLFVARKMQALVRSKKLTKIKEGNDLIRTLEDYIKEIHQDEYWDKEENIKSATTLVFIVFNKNNDKYCIANVGDSRCYYVDSEKKEIKRLTTDQETETGLLTSAINKNQIEEITIDVTEGEIKKGDIFLLATDGLFKKMNDEEILNAILDNNIKNYKEKLIHMEKELRNRGERDDITALIMLVE